MKVYLYRVSGDKVDATDDNNFKIIEIQSLNDIKKILEIYGQCVLIPCDYLNLTDETGETPSIKVLGIDLYLTIKGYWSGELEVNQLAKLDKFLSNIN